MYKDKSKQKEAARLRKQRQRDKRRDTDDVNVTPCHAQDVTPFDVIPIGYQSLIQGIIDNRKAAGLFDDSKERWERAERYWRWYKDKWQPWHQGLTSRLD